MLRMRGIAVSAILLATMVIAGAGAALGGTAQGGQKALTRVQVAPFHSLTAANREAEGQAVVVRLPARPAVKIELNVAHEPAQLPVELPSGVGQPDAEASLPAVAASLAVGMVEDRLENGLVQNRTALPTPTRQTAVTRSNAAAPAQPPAPAKMAPPGARASSKPQRATATPVRAMVPPGEALVSRPPSISAKTIDAVLKAYHSPSYGHGQQFYDLGVKYGVDPAFMLAFYLKESTMGTAGAATITKNIGNIICTPQWSDAGGACLDRWRVYPSDVAGAEDWYQLISYEYKAKGLVTVEQIVPKYAPLGDCNQNKTICNDPPSYIHDVETSVAWFRWLEHISK